GRITGRPALPGRAVRRAARHPAALKSVRPSGRCRRGLVSATRRRRKTRASRRLSGHARRAPSGGSGSPVRRTMPTLAEQIIPRRKLLLMVSELAIFASILFLGTSLPPLASRQIVFEFAEAEFWRGLGTCIAIA